MREWIVRDLWKETQMRGNCQAHTRHDPEQRAHRSGELLRDAKRNGRCPSHRPKRGGQCRSGLLTLLKQLLLRLLLRCVFEVVLLVLLLVLMLLHPGCEWHET